MNIEFSTGATASFTMVAHTQLICDRQTRLHFAFGELVGDMYSFTVTDFRTRKTTAHTPKNEGGGHGGGELNGSVALDEAIAYLGEHTYDQLAAPGARQAAKTELSHRVAERYHHDVMEVYFTEFVMQ